MLDRVIAWQKIVDAGTHTVTVTNGGTPGYSRVDVDSITMSASQ